MSKLKVLIAEDDKSILALYRKALLPDIFEPVYADNGREALELYRSSKPDILILDIMLPEMTGYHILREIREEDGDMLTTIIIASSLSDESASKYCREFGIQGYLAKPFRHAEVGARVMQWYQEHKEQKSIRKP